MLQGTAHTTVQFCASKQLSTELFTGNFTTSNSTQPLKSKFPWQKTSINQTTELKWNTRLLKQLHTHGINFDVGKLSNI